MSKERSPRAVCSITIGIRGIVLLLGLSPRCGGGLSATNRLRQYRATRRLRYDPRMDQADSEVLVPASPEETWEAITDPDQLGEWLGEDAAVELRPGGDLT